MRKDVLLPIMVLLLLIGCGDSGSSRDEAATFIRDSGLSRDEAATLIREEIAQNPREVTKEIMLKGSMGAGGDVYEEAYEALIADGILAGAFFTKRENRRRSGNSWPEVDVTLTEEGRTFVLEPEKGRRRISVRVQVCLTEFGQIKGIEQVEGKGKAIVSYEQVIAPTPFARLFTGSRPPCRYGDSKVQSRTAYFTKYDDGWKLVDSTQF